MTAAHDPQAGWNRLEETLLRIKPGETIAVDALATETGLLPETIETVLNALTKAELFERKDKNLFIRRRRLQTFVPPGVSPFATSDYRRRYGVTSPTRAARAAPSCS